MKKMLVCVVLSLSLFLTSCGAPKDVPPQTFELSVTSPDAPTQKVEVALGAELTLRITTPVDDAVHVHGYEIEKDLPAGQPTDIVFVANMAGSYEVESHITDAVWLTLVVS